jgi:uncharacterized RDD family membrane protein YckC
MQVWIGRQGERLGPYEEAEVRAWLRNGEVSPDDLGWYEGIGDWQPLSQLFPEDAAAAPSPRVVAHAIPPLPGQTQAAPRTVAAAASYGGFWKRVGAYLIDGLVLLVPMLIVGYAMGLGVAEAKMGTALDAGTNPVIAFAQFQDDMFPARMVWLAMSWLYFACFEASSWQATPGKRALGMMVTDAQGQRIGFGRASARFFAKLISGFILMIGYLMAGWTARKQALHDLIASTLVVNGKPGAPTSGTPDDQATLSV